MRLNKKIIAITGGIGAGKSVVCGILSELGEICLSCDKINAELLKNADYLDGLSRLFPIVFSNNALDKAKLKEIIAYSDKERLKLNAYSHNKIKNKLIEIINEIDNDRIFVEIPLLNQSDFIELFNEIWVIECPIDTRIDRIMLRDNMSETIANAIISAQNPLHEYKAKTIFLQNHGSIPDLRQQILKLL